MSIQLGWHNSNKKTSAVAEVFIIRPIVFDYLTATFLPLWMKTPF